MLSRILFASRWLIATAIVVGATQLPAAAQTEPMPLPNDGTAQSVIGRPAVANQTPTQPPVYEMVVQRAQMQWGA